MKKVLTYLKVQKYLILILASITVFVVATSIRIHNNKKHNVEEEVRAIEAKLPIKENLAIEVGSIIPEIKDYFNDNREITSDATIKYYLDDKEVKIEDICSMQNKKCITNKVNTYKVIINTAEEYVSSLMVVDNTPPEVLTNEVTINSGDDYKIESFIKTYTDNSGSKEYDASYIDESQAKITNVGTAAIKLKVCDKSKNCTEVTARLVIEKKEESPKTSSGSTGSSSSGKSTGKSTGKTSGKSSGKSSSGGSSSGGGNSSGGGSSSGGGGSAPKCTEQDKTEKEITSSKSIYGTQENTYVNVTYHYDTNCNKTEKSRSAEKFEVVYSTFNGTTAQMKSEAASLYNSQSGIRSTILNNTNAYRAEVGAGNLSIDYNLSVMATIRAMEMAYSNKFSHTRPSGKQWHTIWDEYGIGKGQVIGENLGKGYTSPDGVSKGWRNSPTHYENLINARFTKIGIGKYTYQGVTYWAQEFSS